MEKKMQYRTLEELYEGMYLLIYKFIGDYTNDGWIADDISSAVWHKVSEKPEKYLGMEIPLLKNYLRKMARNMYYSYCREDARQQISIEDVGENEFPSQSAEDSYFSREDLKRLQEAIRSLPEEEQRLLLSRLDEKQSSREIGEKLGISEGAVRVRQHRILKKLKKMMEEKKNQDE